jgi:23S rRNA (uridine2552-2'-O)-methyltransferase
MTRRSKSSHRWLERQRRDPYARRAQQEGQISRAHFKLLQLDQRFHLLRPGMRVLELGAAPGGWTRVLEDRLAGGLLIACDSRPVGAAGDTVVIAGELGEDATDAAIEAALVGRRLDLVLSDMAPNISGVRVQDQAQSMYLADLALDAAVRWLQPGGDLVVKLFQGEGIDQWVAGVRERFGKVHLVKPNASRPDSREVYAVARSYLGAIPAAD